MSEGTQRVCVACGRCGGERAARGGHAAAAITPRIIRAAHTALGAVLDSRLKTLRNRTESD